MLVFYCLNCMEPLAADCAVCPLCGKETKPAVQQPDHLRPGTLLQNRYLIGLPLGRGGFGITYLARDINLDRKVAIKEYLPSGLAYREANHTAVRCITESSQRFRWGIRQAIEEARKLAKLTDLEQVVNVHDAFEANGTAYIVMDYLPGDTVKDRVRRDGPMSFEETLRILTPVLLTLARVHKTGLIHRDIAPDNIKLCNDGRITLLDFGAARDINAEDNKTRSVILKPGYAPIEQYSSKNKQGPYVDIYAVCATAYFMLTGTVPETAPDRYPTDTLVPVAELAQLPDHAAQAIMQGMAMHVEDRIPSAEELLRRLRGDEAPPKPGLTPSKPELSKPAPSKPEPMTEEPETEGFPTGYHLFENSETAGGSEEPVTRGLAPLPTSEDTAGSAKPAPKILPIVLAAVGVVAFAAAAVLLMQFWKNRPAVQTAVMPATAAASTEATAAATTEFRFTTAATTAPVTTTAAPTTATQPTTTALDVSQLATGYIRTQKADSKVNLRAGPGTDTKSLASLSNGTEVKIVGKEGDWYRVLVNGVYGYVSAEYVSNQKTLTFSDGNFKNGVYYNEWANIKFSYPEDWQIADASGIADYLKEINGFQKAYIFRDYFNDEDVAFLYYKGNMSEIMRKVDSGRSTQQSTKTLAGETYTVLEYSGRSDGEAYFVAEYYRQIDDYVVVIRFYTNSYANLQAYAGEIKAYR